jgi:hypothetical protein
MSLFLPFQKNKGPWVSWWFQAAAGDCGRLQGATRGHVELPQPKGAAVDYGEPWELKGSAGGHREPQGAAEGHKGPQRAIRGQVELLEATKGHEGPPGAMRGH